MNIRTVITSLFSVAIGVLDPIVTFAQAPSTGGKADDQTILEEIIVTARKTQQNLQTVPVAVSALTASALEQASVTKMTDLSAVAPSLNIKGSGSGAQSVTFALRGQSQSGILLTQDISVGVYMDGIANPRPLALYGEFVDIKQVEVLRGSQGTLFGRNTTGGAITITTNEPTDELGAVLRGRIGNESENDFLAIFNVPITDNLASRWVLNKRDNGGYAHDLNGRPLGDEDSTYLRGKLLGTWGDFELAVTAHYSRLESGGPVTVMSGMIPATATAPAGGTPSTSQVASDLGLPLTQEGLAEASEIWQQEIWRGSGRRIYMTTPQQSDNENYGLGVIVRWAMSEQWEFRSLTGWHSFERLDDFDLDGSSFDIYFIRVPTDDDFFSQEFQAQGSFDDVDVLFGLYADYENGHDGQTSIINPVVFPTQNVVDGEVTSKSVAAFAQANWRITDSLTATLGARYTQDTKELDSRNRNTAGTCRIPDSLLQRPGVCYAEFSKKFREPTWLASLDYRLANHTLLYGKISRGYKAGGHQLRAAGSEAAFEPFAPEFVTEYEIGTKSELLGRRLRLNLAAFYSDFSNIQRQVLTGGGATTAVTNAAEATLYGAELEMNLALARGLTVTGAVSYLNAEYDEFMDFTGDRSDEAWPAPDWMYSLAAEYSRPVPVGGLTLQLSYQGQSEQNLYPQSTMPDALTQSSYGVLNGALRLELDDLGLELALYGRNLTNELYKTSGIGLELVGFSIANLSWPRTYGIELTARFGGER